MDSSRELVVLEVRQEAPLIRSLHLGHPDSAPLPGFEPGDHVKVRMPAFENERHYSLINADPSPGATAAPARYHIAVRLDEAGTGGSRAMHGLNPGDRLQVSAPIHGFPLQPGSGPVLLLAGGIGVTPLISMAAALRAQGRPFRVRHCGRTRDQLAFVDDLRALAGPDNLTVHCDDEQGCVLDVAGVFDGLPADASVYVCGPAPMIEAVITEGGKRGFGSDRVRFELFQAAAPKTGDRAFEVELKQSGKVFTVPPGQTILDVLIAAGEDPLHDCRRGDCGICQVGVLEGEVDHRDFVLSEAERAANNVMQICVSRAKSPRLVLDL
jgi:vanillate O-demethylase ferredoxin subunit